MQTPAQSLNATATMNAHVANTLMPNKRGAWDGRAWLKSHSCVKLLITVVTEKLLWSIGLVHGAP